jgi:hypothetical protein
MSLLTRTYTFTDGTTAYGSQVDSEISNIVNTLNNLDSAAITWTNVKVTTLLPQADVSLGGHKVTNLGTPTTSGDAIAYPVTASVITAGTITTTQIAAGTITGSNIAASTITKSNLSLSAGDITQVQSSTATTSTHGTDITTVTITTTGGKVLLIGSATINMAGAPSSVGVSIAITQGNTGIVGAESVGLIGSNISATFPMSLVVVDTPAAGTYTYKLSYIVQNGSFSSCARYSLQAIELKA